MEQQREEVGKEVGWLGEGIHILRRKVDGMEGNRAVDIAGTYQTTGVAYAGEVVVGLFLVQKAQQPQHLSKDPVVLVQE